MYPIALLSNPSDSIDRRVQNFTRSMLSIARIDPVFIAIVIMLTNQDFQLLEEITPDSTGIINFGSTATAHRYRILVNPNGQILLDPVRDPEAWFWNNSETIAAVQTGIAPAAAGEVHDLGSFAKYADLDIDD